VLARVERGRGYIAVFIRAGEVENDVHRRVAEQFIQIPVYFLDPILRRPALRLFTHKIAYARDLQLFAENRGQVLQIDAADVAASGDAHSFHYKIPL
jgi:hypothetical protein